MKDNTLGITLMLFILILLAFISIVIFNKDKINNQTHITPYTEKNETYTIANNTGNEKKEVKAPICLASFTTNITYNNENRVHNIKTVCDYLNNHIIKSGETFSFNEALGPFSEEKGYVESTGFDSEGELIKIIAGGICQVSSTLYNTVLMANLEIVERHEHSNSVDYVPKGKDATVCYSGVDFKFKNTTQKDIIIKSYCNGNTVKIELYNENT